MVPAKRKAPGPSSRAQLRSSPGDAGCTKALAPASAACAPAMSSPAIGAWALHGSSEDGAEPGCDSRFRDTAGSLRSGKALRVCSDAAAAAAAAGPPEGTPCSPAAGEGRPLSCQGSGGAALGACSLPPGMYRSFHLGCCSRLNSSSSLTELEAAAAAVVLGSGEGDADPATAVAACPAGTSCKAAAFAEPGSCAAAAASAADVTPAGLAAAAASRPSQPSWPPPSPVCGAAQQGQLAWRRCDEGEEAAGAGEAAGASRWHDVPDDILKRVRRRCGGADAWLLLCRP